MNIKTIRNNDSDSAIARSISNMMPNNYKKGLVISNNELAVESGISDSVGVVDPTETTRVGKPKAVSVGMPGKGYNQISLSPTVLSQDYSTIALWNPVASIIFTSNLIPIYQSQTPPIQVYANGQIVNNSSSFNYLNVITDFIANDMQFVPYIQYAASVYRYLSLKPNTEIRNIDLQVYWQNKNNGKLKPLYLGVGGSASVKLFLSRI